MVSVVPYDPSWPEMYRQEADVLVRFLPCLKLHHIGSTSVVGMTAKPVVDMLGVVASLDLIDGRTNDLETLGYEVKGAHGLVGRRYFRKSNTWGQRTHHLHVFTQGSLHIERLLAFRDYLRAHPWVVTQYAHVKSEAQSGSGAKLYPEAKAPFIAKVEQDALIWSRTAGGG
jgi:GrpB-like predicted nucleotidyltransferase (UPF0157 family)